MDHILTLLLIVLFLEGQVGHAGSLQSRFIIPSTCSRWTGFGTIGSRRSLCRRRRTRRRRREGRRPLNPRWRRAEA